jgi:hypothetical protein
VVCSGEAALQTDDARESSRDFLIWHYAATPRDANTAFAQRARYHADSETFVAIPLIGYSVLGNVCQVAGDYRGYECDGHLGSAHY